MSCVHSLATCFLLTGAFFFFLSALDDTVLKFVPNAGPLVMLKALLGMDTSLSSSSFCMIPVCFWSPHFLLVSRLGSHLYSSHGSMGSRPPGCLQSEGGRENMNVCLCLRVSSHVSEQGCTGDAGLADASPIESQVAVVIAISCWSSL